MYTRETQEDESKKNLGKSADPALLSDKTYDTMR